MKNRNETEAANWVKFSDLTPTQKVEEVIDCILFIGMFLFFVFI